MMAASTTAPIWLAPSTVLLLLALLGYGLAMWPARGAAPAPSTSSAGAGEGAAALPLPPGQTGAAPRWPALALFLGWLAHLGVLIWDIGALAHAGAGVRLGFAPVLSVTVWLVIGGHALESRFLPLPQVRFGLAAAGLCAAALAFVFPGEFIRFRSAAAPVHFVLGVGSYALFGAAVLHALMLDSAERRLRARHASPLPPAAGGLPLLRLERLTFRFVQAGFVVLSATLLLGMLVHGSWSWEHKTVFSLLSWAVFAALLFGRWRYGWRGHRATRWLYGGTLLLLLGYVGSRFVFEVILGRLPA
jgi:ABC-type uncharacterized transport system permease subunit